MSRYIVKKNHMGSAVSKIFRTHIETQILLLLYLRIHVVIFLAVVDILFCFRFTPRRAMPCKAYNHISTIWSSSIWWTVWVTQLWCIQMISHTLCLIYSAVTNRFYYIHSICYNNGYRKCGYCVRRILSLI